MSGCFIVMQTSSRTFCVLFLGEKGNIVLERGEKNINLSEFSIKKNSWKESHALLQMYFGGMKLMKCFSYLSLLHYKEKQLIRWEITGI